VQKLLANIYDTLGFEDKKDDTQVTLLHRVSVVTWACRLGIEHCVKNSAGMFSGYEKNTEHNMYVYHNYLIRHNLRREYTLPTD
jgi:hypothetical protein